MKNSSYKIIIIDQDQHILAELSEALRKENYTTYTVNTAEKGLEIIHREAPHMIISELLLNDIDGIDLCMEIRENSLFDNTLVVITSTRGDSYSHIAALNAGADDFLLKPINSRFLVSKVKSLLRRCRISDASNTQEVEGFRIDREKYLIWYKENEITLPRKEFEILSLLASRPGKVFRREEIKNEIWGKHQFVRSRTIDVHIRKLREKIGERFIKTIKGVGYKFSI